MRWIHFPNIHQWKRDQSGTNRYDTGDPQSAPTPLWNLRRSPEPLSCSNDAVLARDATDAEGDTLNVRSDAEFVEACRVFLSGNHDELKSLKFTAVEREGSASSTNPAEEACLAILRTLHDLGDILWFEDLGIEYLKTTVILHPLVLIDFLRQVAHHNHSCEVLPHGTLKGLPFWAHLDKDGLLMMKILLQHFQLIHPTRGDMQWDSDVLVPAYWRTNESALWLFCNDILRLDPNALFNRDTPPEPIRVQWEYHFTTALPEVIFDQLMVASYDSRIERFAGPDRILYQDKGKYACRMIVTRAPVSNERVLRLEAVAASRDDTKPLWTVFKRLCTALEKVLSGYKGLMVTRHAINELGQPRRIYDVVSDWKEADVEDRHECSWLPPDLEWYAGLMSKRIAESGSTGVTRPTLQAA